jgi:signal transduction histidine kinase
LPELECLSLEEALELAISNHERRSSTSVGFKIPRDCPSVPASIKTCVYRFVQEGLNNAFRHAGGTGQHVSVSCDADMLSVEVSDKGPGLAAANAPSSESGLGLSGLRDRIESLGGSMLVRSAEGEGTRLRASFCLVKK